MSRLFTPIVESIRPSGHDILFAQKRISGIQSLDTFAAKKVESNLEAIILRMDPKQLMGIEEWPQSEGFHVVLRPAEGGDKNSVLLCLELLAMEYREVFIALAEDVCLVLQQASDPEEAVQQFYNRLVRWQEFLRQHRPDGLSSEQQLGLYGELLLLRDMFIDQLSPAQAIRGWRGCKKANQDFQHDSLALEVKSTRAVTPDRIHISNVQQLDEEGIDNMFLSVVWVHVNDAAGETLPEVVRSIRNLLTDPIAATFNEGLIEVGYLDVQEARYQNDRYQLRELMHFKVEGDFPRIKRHQIPQGVKAVKYQIGLDACQNYRIDHRVIVSTIASLRGDN